MTDEELTAFLRDLPFLRAAEAADRIEALTAEREFFEEEWVSAVDKLNKAVELAKEAIETMASGPFFPDEEERRLLSKLAEIESSEAVTLEGEKG
jgi:hypothetical protein